MSPPEVSNFVIPQTPLWWVRENVRLPGWNLNGRYVPDNAAITYRSDAMKELNIKSGETSQKTGDSSELRVSAGSQMSGRLLLQPFAPSNVSMRLNNEYKWTKVPEPVPPLHQKKVGTLFLDQRESLHNHACKSFHIRACIPFKLHVMHTLDWLRLRSSLRVEWPPRESSNRFVWWATSRRISTHWWSLSAW